MGNERLFPGFVSSSDWHRTSAPVMRADHGRSEPHPGKYYDRPMESSAGKSEQKLFESGVLQVQIFEARGIKGDEFVGFGKADPYLKVRHGTACKKVELSSEPHKDGGSNPIFNTEFSFPMRNGGTEDHNRLEVELFDKNLLKDTRLGSVVLGGLANFVTKKQPYITEAAWYPVFRYDKATKKFVQHGEIVLKFYFREVEAKAFAEGCEGDPRCWTISCPNRVNGCDNYGKAVYEMDGLFKILGTLVPLIIPFLTIA